MNEQERALSRLDDLDDATVNDAALEFIDDMLKKSDAVDAGNDSFTPRQLKKIERLWLDICDL